LEFERNNWLSESSILIRSMPKIAAIISPSRMTQDSTGALTAISPIRSSPKAMLVPVCGSSIASTWT